AGVIGRLRRRFSACSTREAFALSIVPRYRSWSNDRTHFNADAGWLNSMRTIRFNCTRKFGLGYIVTRACRPRRPAGTAVLDAERAFSSVNSDGESASSLFACIAESCEG